MRLGGLVLRWRRGSGRELLTMLSGRNIWWGPGDRCECWSKAIG